MNKKGLIVSIIPGIFLAGAIAVPAIYLHSLYKPVSAVALAIVLALLVRNVCGMPVSCKAGNSFVVKKVLRFAIILLGVRLSFSDVVQIGGNSLLVIICCIIMAILLTQYLARLAGLPGRLGTLIGVGTCICGNSAIVATAPAIEAEEEEVAFAVATITLFGTVAVFIYPLLGKLLQMSDVFFGTWAGTAINDTSQVVTAGYIFGEEAGDIATVVKLTRNLFMAPVIVMIGFWYRRGQNGAEGSKKISYKKAFPLFVVGFVVMAILRTLGVFSTEAIAVLKTTANYLIVLSVAAVGLNTSFSAMRKTGLKPFYVGLGASVLMACSSWALIKILGIV